MHTVVKTHRNCDGQAAIGNYLFLSVDYTVLLLETVTLRFPCYSLSHPPSKKKLSPTTRTYTWTLLLSLSVTILTKLFVVLHTQTHTKKISLFLLRLCLHESLHKRSGQQNSIMGQKCVYVVTLVTLASRKQRVRQTVKGGPVRSVLFNKLKCAPQWSQDVLEGSVHCLGKDFFHRSRIFENVGKQYYIWITKYGRLQILNYLKSMFKILIIVDLEKYFNAYNFKHIRQTSCNFFKNFLFRLTQAFD